MPCTDPIILMLESFRPLFPAPTWKNMLTPLRGTLLARGRRTVTAALWQTGHDQDPHFSAFHQVRSSARWSPLEASRQLLTLIVDTFVQAGGPLDIVIDETLERRWGAKIRKRGHYRDSALSSRNRSVSSPGLRWIVLAVVVQVPWTRQRWALPDLSVLATTPEVSQQLGLRHKTLGMRAHQLVRRLSALAAGSAAQAHGRPGPQYPGTGAAVCEASRHADCPLSSRLGHPPTATSAQQVYPWAAPGFGQTLALGRAHLA